MYQPPYDSPIEEIFAWQCTKYLRSNVAFDPQVKLDTQHGQFRMDFVLADADEKVAVECDGHDFHDLLRDEFRDAILLGEGLLDTIYHFRGCDLTYYPEQCIWLMATLHSQLFSERGQIQLNRLHKLRIVHSYDFANGESYILADHETGHGLWAFWRTIHIKPGLNPHWKALYAFACKYPSATLDKLLTIRLERLDELTLEV